MVIFFFVLSDCTDESDEFDCPEKNTEYKYPSGYSTDYAYEYEEYDDSEYEEGLFDPQSNTIVTEDTVNYETDPDTYNGDYEYEFYWFIFCM